MADPSFAADRQIGGIHETHASLQCDIPSRRLHLGRCALGANDTTDHNGGTNHNESSRTSRTNDRKHGAGRLLGLPEIGQYFGERQYTDARHIGRSTAQRVCAHRRPAESQRDDSGRESTAQSGHDASDNDAGRTANYDATNRDATDYAATNGSATNHGATVQRGTEVTDHTTNDWHWRWNSRSQW